MHKSPRFFPHCPNWSVLNSLVFDGFLGRIPLPHRGIPNQLPSRHPPHPLPNKMSCLTKTPSPSVCIRFCRCCCNPFGHGFLVICLHCFPTLKIAIFTTNVITPFNRFIQNSANLTRLFFSLGYPSDHIRCVIMRKPVARVRISIHTTPHIHMPPDMSSYTASITDEPGHRDLILVS